MNLKISALDYVQEVQNGNISAEDFIASTLEHIKKVDGNLHAFLSVNDDAVNQAKEIDKKQSDELDEIGLEVFRRKQSEV